MRTSVRGERQELEQSSAVKVRSTPSKIGPSARFNCTNETLIGAHLLAATPYQNLGQLLLWDGWQTMRGRAVRFDDKNIAKSGS